MLPASDRGAAASGAAPSDATRGTSGTGSQPNATAATSGTAAERQIQVDEVRPLTERCGG
jgi:hypothetical protein